MAFTQICAANASMTEVNFTTSTQGFTTINSAGIGNNAQFVVQTLKYEPYPVNAGDWFDLWIKVQNVGVSDASNAEFELVPSYPFSSNDTLIRDYGVVPGTQTAFNNKNPGEAKIQTNQVIMKFRVKVADDAPQGKSMIQFRAKADKDSEYSVSLPIEIGKTKTDFDVVLQDSSSTGMSFAIANTGENLATAVTVSVEPQNNVRINGVSATILGNLAAGDFTTFTFPIIVTATRGTNSEGVKIKVSYTDSAGIRSFIEKTVSIPLSSSGNSTSYRNGATGTANGIRKTTATIPAWVYIAGGVIIGIVVSFIYIKTGKKKKE